MWKFPIPSETFIRREIEALRNSGLKVTVVSEYKPDAESNQDAFNGLIDSTIYIRPVSPSLLNNNRNALMRRMPFKVTSLFLYTLGRRYHYIKECQYDRGVFLYMLYVSEVVSKLNATSIHSPWADLQAFIASGVASLLDLPYSIHARAHDIHRHTSRYGFREKYGNACFIATNSHYNKSHLSSLLDADDARKIEVIYNGLPLAQFTHCRDYSTPAVPVRYLCVARLIEEKGLLVLLQAITLLRKRNLSFQLKIIGGPELPLYADYYETLMEKYNNLELEGRVRFAGSLSNHDVIGAMSAAHIFVLPCVFAKNGGRDITPNALLEAMAMELPVISTTISAIPEIVDHDVNGLLVPPGNVHSLADAMQRLAGSVELRTRLGSAARTKIEERFDIRKNIQRYVELHKNAG
jgi:colanic acid/amylovoran biosynthesis glycosyltransferase